MIPNVLADDTVEPLAKTILARTLRILPLAQYSSRETGLFDGPGDGDERRSRARIDPERREHLKRDFIAFHQRYRSDRGITMPRDYLVTIGYRR